MRTPVACPVPFLLCMAGFQLFAQELSPTLLFDGSTDPQLANGTFSQPVVDSQGRVVATSWHYGIWPCPSGYGIRLNAISSSGLKLWQTSGPNGYITCNVREQSNTYTGVSIGNDGSIYMRGQDDVYRYSPAGGLLPGWPVNVASAYNFLFTGSAYNPSDGTYYAKADDTPSLHGVFSQVIVALNGDGTERWRTTSTDSDNQFAIVRGPAGGIYTVRNGNLLGFDGAGGAPVCAVPLGITYFGSFTGGSDALFTSGPGAIIRYDGHCNPALLAAVPDQQTLLSYSEGRLYVSRYDPALSDPYRYRLLAYSKDGGLLWENSRVALKFPGSPLQAVKGGILYVLGYDLIDANRAKLFLVDAVSGQVINTVSTAEICPNQACGVAVSDSYALYVNDLNSTKIYRINVPPPIPVLLVAPAALTFTTVVDSTAPIPSQQLTISSSTGAALNLTATATTSTGGAWLSVAPLQGLTPAQLSADVSVPVPHGLPAGTYQGLITVTAAGVSNSPLPIPVTLNVFPPAILTLTPKEGSAFVSSTYTVRASLRTPGGGTLPGEHVQFTISGTTSQSRDAITDANGIASFSYVSTTVGTDSVVATAKIRSILVSSAAVVVHRTPVSDAQALAIELAPILKKQKLNAGVPIWNGLLKFAEEQRLSLAAGSDDACYFGAIDATAVAARTAALTIPLDELARDIFQMPLSLLATPSLLGNVLVQTASFLIDVAGTPDIGRDTLKSFTQQSLGYALTKASTDYMANVFAPGLNSISENAIKKLLGEDDVSMVDGDGNNLRSQFREAGALLTTVHVGAAYNAFSHYVTVGVRAACEGESGTKLYLLRYAAKPDGTATGPVSIWPVGSGRCRQAQ